MIYIIHFSEKFHHCRHYIGFVDEHGRSPSQAVEERLARHRSGQGAKILRALNEKGISYEIVSVIEGDRNFERKLKQQKNSKLFCPFCTTDNAYQSAARIKRLRNNMNGNNTL